MDALTPNRARPGFAAPAGLWLAALALCCTEPRPAADAGVAPGDDSSAPTFDAGTAPALHDSSFRLHDEIESVVYARWEQEVSATSLVRYRVADEPWRQTPAQARAPGPQEQIVLGVPYESHFELVVVATTEEGERRSEVVAGDTGPVPDMPTPVLQGLDETATEPGGRYLFGSVVPSEGQWNPSGSFWSYIMDRSARLVWARRTPNLHATIYPRVSTSGRDFLIDDNTFWFNFDPSASTVQRVKIDGSVVRSYPTPGLHHPFTELGDGTVVWGATRSATEETLEAITPDGEKTTLWDSATFLASLIPAPKLACFQSNALFWDEESGTFLFSSYCGFYIVQIARDGSVVRILGGELPQAFRAVPDDARFFWQHGVTLTDERTLLSAMHVFDGHEGVIREYELDDLTKTLEQTWSWKDGLGTETTFAGEAHRLANGNTLLNYGTTPLVREVTPDGDIVWQVGWSEQSTLGRSVFLEDLYAFAP